jgi:hypothetical protein
MRHFLSKYYGNVHQPLCILLFLDFFYNKMSPYTGVQSEVNAFKDQQMDISVLTGYQINEPFGVRLSPPFLSFSLFSNCALCVHYASFCRRAALFFLAATYNRQL